MFSNTESIVKKYLQSDSEEIFWSGQSVISKHTKALKPILALLTLITVAFFLYAGYVYISDISPQTITSERKSTVSAAKLPESKNEVWLSLVGGLFFLAFRIILPRMIKREDITVYAITNQRAFIIDHRNKRISAEWGPGDLQETSVLKRGESSGDILFSEEPKHFGKTVEGSVRKQVSWDGFINVDDVQNAVDALKKLASLRGETYDVYNKGLKFRISLPYGWTTHTHIFMPEQRDNLFLSAIIGDFIGGGRLLKNVKFADEWNTVVLTRKIAVKHDPGNSRLDYLTVLIEVAPREEMPVIGVSRSFSDDAVDLNSLVKDPANSARVLNQQMLICEFNNLTEKDKKMNHYKARISEAAREIKLLEGLKGYEHTGSVGFMGQGYRFKQIYLYQNLEYAKKCLHFRFTFFCSDRDKGKFFKIHHGILNTLAKSVKLMIPRRIES